MPPPASTTSERIDWKKILLLTSKPGAGKTHCIKEAIYQERSILVATPTGFVASTYSATFLEDVDTDTVHSAFKYPVNTEEQSETNWDLMHYDLVVHDFQTYHATRSIDH